MSRPRLYPRLAAFLVAAACTLAPATSAAASGHDPVPRCRPSVRALPSLGGPFAEAMAFNSRHVVVGGALTPDEAAVATYWADGRLRRIPTGLAEDEALDVNDRGLIVGTGVDPATEAPVAWAFVDGRVHRLRGFGGPTVVRRINEPGVMVGDGVTSDGVNRPLRWRHWRAEPEILPLLPGDEWGFALGVNDRGEAVGASVGPDAFHPVVWDRRGEARPLTLRPEAGFDWGYAISINHRGQATGTIASTLPDTPQHAARWHGQRLTDLGVLPGDTTGTGTDIADNGWVVGASERYSPVRRESRHAFFWPGHGPILALPTLASRWATSESNAHGVDEHGTVAGFSSDDAGIRRATIWTCAHRLAFQPTTANPGTDGGPATAQQPNLSQRPDRLLHRPRP